MPDQWRIPDADCWSARVAERIQKNIEQMLRDLPRGDRR